MSEPITSIHTSPDDTSEQVLLSDQPNQVVTNDTSEDVLMEDVEDNSSSESHLTSEQFTPTSVEESNNSSSTIKSRKSLRPPSQASYTVVKQLREDVDKWVKKQETLKPFIAKTLSDSITPLMWLDTMMDKLVVQPDCGKAIRGWIASDDGLMEQGLEGIFDTHGVSAIDREPFTRLLKDNLMSLLKNTFNGEKFAHDKEDQMRMCDARTFKAFKEVLEHLDKGQANDPIPAEMLCFLKLSESTRTQGHDNFHDYFVKSIRDRELLMEQYKLTSEQMNKIYSFKLIMDNANCYESTDEIYKMFKEFINSGDLSNKSYNKVARDNKRINVKLKHKNPSQSFFVLNKKEMTKIYNASKPMLYGEYLKLNKITNNEKQDDSKRDKKRKREEVPNDPKKRKENC